MKVLITNVALDDRAGSELYAHDLARTLKARGHAPVVYSARLGRVAQEIRQRAVPVIDDRASLGDEPDLIHGQHHLPTMTALALFPTTPAVYFCHGWLPWEEAPPRHPAIRRYVAVSEATRERVVSEAGVSPDRVQIVPNFVDLQRFLPRGPLPPRPRRALLFSNGAPRHGWVQDLRTACSAAGIALDVAGLAYGNPIDDPEHRLPAYDLVFARGRCALEAMAVGAAVVLCDVEGVGPMVTAANFERLRRGNFGSQVLLDPHRADVFVREIARYDAAEAQRVSAILRATAGLDDAVDLVLDIYDQALAEAKAAPVRVGAARAATSRYLMWLNRTLPAPWLEEREIRRREAEEFRQQADALRREADASRHEAEQAWHEAEQAWHEAEQARRELEPIRSSLAVRYLLPPLWRARRALLPEGSSRFRVYRRLRSAFGRWLRRERRRRPAWESTTTTEGESDGGHPPTAPGASGPRR